MSRPSRPRKRQRTGKNIFVDLEAVAGEGSEDEEEEEVAQVQEEPMTEEQDGENNEHLALFQCFIRADEENGEDADGWNALLERASRRTGARREDHPEEERDPGYQLQDNDMLWEIGCKVGCEETVAFNVLRRSQHPTMPEELAVSVVATSVPGRIYAELSSFAKALKLARSVAELDASHVIPVPREQITSVLNIASSEHIHHQWARVGGRRRKWSWYLGDTGLIEMLEGSRKKYLALLPRLPLGQDDALHSRPPQALVTREHLQALVGVGAVKEDLHGRYSWKGHTFSTKGLLLVDLDDIDILPWANALPTSVEFATFQSTSVLSSQEVAETANNICQTRLKPGDRVKVKGGEYVGMLGEIMEIIEDVEVAVYLPSQDLLKNMRTDSVRAAYCVGDQIRVLDGEHLDLTGWVVGISADSIRVFNIKQQIEVDVAKTNVQFHCPMHIVGLTPRAEYPKWGKLGGRNPNDVYVGKRVMVIGMHELKGYKGNIKETTPDGKAFVQLDSRLQKTVQVMLIDLASLTDNDTPTSYLLSQHSLPSALAPSSSTTIPSELPGTTPTWDPSSHTQLLLSPAWDPSCQTPNPSSHTPISADCPSRPPHWLGHPSHQTPNPSSHTPISADRPSRPHWLEDPAFTNLRIKLETKDPSVRSPVLEFMGIENDHVRVKDMSDYKLLPFGAVSGLLPSADLRAQFVIPKVGEHKGVMFKVRHFAQDECVVRKLGTKPAKNQADPTFRTIDLVQVFPASRSY